MKTTYLAVGIALFCSTVRGSLIGDVVQFDMQPNGSFWSAVPASATVIDPGIEAVLRLIPAGGSDFFSVDVAASSITVTALLGLSAGASELLTISDLDWTPPAIITGFTLSTFGAITGIDASDVSFTDDSVQVSMTAADYEPGSGYRIDLITAPVAAVPELASISVWAVLACLVGFRRTRF
jgi:hypothetical protein